MKRFLNENCCMYRTFTLERIVENSTGRRGGGVSTIEVDVML